MKFFLFFILLFLTSNTFAANKFALVIGNSNYPSRALRNPVNDARLISEKLTELDFKVTEKEDMTLSEMRETIRDFMSQIADNDVVFFFYAGHGTQLGSVNFLIPVDADPKSEDEIPDEALDINFLFRKLALKKTINLVILDACRNNPFRSFSRSAADEGLAYLNAPDNTFVAFSTAPGKTASDGTGDNSPFTKSLANVIQSKGKTVDQVFNEVRANVQNSTSGMQMPWQMSSLMSDYCLNDCTAKPDGSGNPPPKVEPTTPPSLEASNKVVMNLTTAFYMDMMNANLDDMFQFFDFPISNYFDTLNMTKDGFTRQMTGYFAKWASREAEIKSLEIISNEDNQKKVSVKLVYRYKFLDTKGEKYTGKSTNSITFIWKKNRYVIDSVTEKISRF